MVIGACTGREDLFLRKFVRMEHWRGVMVEPDSRNALYLQEFLQSNNMTAEKGFVVQAAVSDACGANGKVTFYRPKKVNASAEDYTVLDLEFGSIERRTVERAVTAFKSPGMDSFEVTCVSAYDILKQANKHFSAPTNHYTRHDLFNPKEVLPFEPLVVRVDTEGHDAAVLMNYFAAVDLKVYNASMCQFPPLMYYWEQNKLSKEQEKQVKRALRQRGYATHEDFFPGRWNAQDMYALLRPDASQYWQMCQQIPYEEGVFL